MLQIVFLGNGRSGKTSILGTLAKKNLNPEERSTRGIEVDAHGLDAKTSMLSKRKMGFPDMELTWWDFAGQLEYSAAHQYFLSSRQALYAIVFSVQEDNESIMQQLFHWLSVIPETQAHVVRIIIVGTKIDLIPHMQLKDTLRMKRNVVQQVIDTKGLTNKISPHDVVFVTASEIFKASMPMDLEQNWKTCRHALKTRIYHHIKDIFSLEADVHGCKDAFEVQRRKDEFDRMRYPKDCKNMSEKVTQLRLFLKENRQIPCLKLDNEHAIRVLGSLWRGRDLEHCKNYFKTDMGIRALDVCHDLGIVSVYGRRNPIPSVCVEPSFTTKIIALLVDPQTNFPAITTVEFLEEILLNHPEVSRIYKDSKKEDKNRQKTEIVELLLSLGLVRRHEGSPKILVPLALRGRPDCWSRILKVGRRYDEWNADRQKEEREDETLFEQVDSLVGSVEKESVGTSQIDSDTTLLEDSTVTPLPEIDAPKLRETAFFLGLRLGVNPAVTVPSAAFIQLMLDKCEDALRMWGCAFAYDVRGYGDGDASSVLFVRLSEDRRSVDVVAVMDEDSECYSVVQAEIESIASLLGEGFNGLRDRMPLCPMCCCTDFFVRSGNVHAFHLQELAAGGALMCTRHHNVTATDCLRGKFTILDLDALPFVYPTKMNTLQLPWRCVSQGGVVGFLETEAEHDAPQLSTPDASSSSSEPKLESQDKLSVSESLASVPSAQPPVAATAEHVSYDDGMFTDVSFFVLTGQVAVGDVIAAEHRQTFLLHIRLCVSEDCSCSITLTSGASKTLRFSFNVGDTFPNPYVQDLAIQGIFPTDVGDKVLLPETPRLQRFCAQDNVLVVFGPIRPKTKFLVFPGTNASLNLVRITPALCKTNSVAAVCWAEMQVSRCYYTTCFMPSYISQFAQYTQT